MIIVFSLSHTVFKNTFYRDSVKALNFKKECNNEILSWIWQTYIQVCKTHYTISTIHVLLYEVQIRGLYKIEHRSIHIADNESEDFKEFKSQERHLTPMI